MRHSHWFIAGILGLLLGGCVSTQTAPTAAPTAETRQALVPTGALRVAFLSGVLYATKDSATGELKGVAVDLGKELARRVGVPFQPVLYPNPAAIVAGAKSGEWDIALMGINAERAAAMDFSAPYIEVEQGYLVRPGVPILTSSDVDKPGIRVGVVERGGADMHLSKTLKNASIVRTKTVSDLDSLWGSGNADVIAATKTFLFDTAAKHPGSRVLDGRLLVEPIGMGVPKGRNAIAAAYVSKFVEQAKAAGLVRSAVDGAGLRGVIVAQ
ncbi:transporter substrate-binding domain-containing protein [Caenimonas soli]|uniref:transporter substrate-binding domain-containing protein n=1 Tax=Caenimonas soli TaxID=2735555 RepID=UPI001557B584|nr:transporter substrate-binding domain-containing protein [Caenimonas soli]NPC54641.1 transporter substrate-binding domain-containing protein [Caenimonas soli]